LRSGVGPIRSALRNVALACVSGVSAFALVASPGCGTSAQGVDDCRDIEQARCVAAAACGTVSDVKDCQIFYRDHCLHGLPTAPPPSADVDSCVNTIKALGTCVEVGGKSVELGACDPPIAADNATLACEVVQYPERAYACSFLAGTPVTPPSGTGGQGGQGGSE
jgi:hypothetical protein